MGLLPGARVRGNRGPGSQDCQGLLKQLPILIGSQHAPRLCVSVEVKVRLRVRSKSDMGRADGACSDREAGLHAINIATPWPERRIVASRDSHGRGALH